MKTIAQQLKITKFPFIINDDNGNELYYEDSNGAWYRCEYDDKSNETYCECSDGYWTRREYDDKGKVTYYECSDGYWVRSEYDDHGNETYCEDSNGLKRGTKRTLPLISSQNGKDLT